MEYRWDDYSLDRERMLLTRQGKQVDVSRKVLNCISHLVEQRCRVVAYDELILKLWGHDNVTNHQLSQIVVAARRAIGDDGKDQRLIRTMPRLGYRWVGELIDSNPVAVLVTVTSQPPQDSNREPTGQVPAVVSDASPFAPRPASMPNPIATTGAKVKWNLRAIAFGLLFFLCAGAYPMLARRGGEPVAQAPSAPVDPISALSKALRAGNFEQVREGLATLPPHLAETPDAKILEIELDIKRARFNNALEKLESHLSQPNAAADPILRARLLILKTIVSSRKQTPPSETLALAESTIAMLDSAQVRVPPSIRAQALERRAIALINSERLDEALRDLALAGKLFKASEDIDDIGRAIDVKISIARVWMRMGRLQDALIESRDAAEIYRRLQDRVPEMYARNTITRIQMEMLRWDDALASNDRSMQLLQEMPDAERRYRTLQLRAQVLTAKGQLRSAASQLEEAAVQRHESERFVIPAFHQLASGDASGAMRTAAKAFDTAGLGGESDILLDNKDGALLLWVAAAQTLTNTGAAMPAPSAAQWQRLQKPKTTLARIARGRWLWSQGKQRDAEGELRRALDESRRMNHLFRMTLAAEPLIEMLLQSNDIAAAQLVITDLRAFDADRMDSDYRVNLLRLRVALAAGDTDATETAYRNTRILAGERELPLEVTTRASAFNLEGLRRFSQN